MERAAPHVTGWSARILGFGDRGGVILSPKIKAVLEDYWKRLKSGEIVDYR